MMSIVKFLSLYEVQCVAWNFTLPFPCVHRATAEEFKQKKPPSEVPWYTLLPLLGCYSLRGEIHLTQKAIFIALGKLSQLAEDVAVKITLFKYFNNQQIGLMKLQIISLPVFHHCFLLQCVYVVIFPFISYT